MSFRSMSSIHEPDLHKLLLSDLPEDYLDQPLQDFITNSLWPSQRKGDSSIYFQYFSLERETWMRSGASIAIETYRDFLDLTDHLKRNRMVPRYSPSILDFFAPPPPSDEKVFFSTQPPERHQLQLPLRDRYPYCDPVAARDSIFFAVRLWLMLNVASSTTNTYIPGRTNPEWPENQSLDDLINSCFPMSELGPKLSQWPSSLNAHSLEYIGGFKISWTDHLADHLYLNEDMDTICVYHHVQVLRGLDCNQGPGQVLPDRLLLETLQTLALLIPRANRKCKHWFERIHSQGEAEIDKAAGDVELLHWARSPEKYQYWGQRLIMIKDAYDASEPKDLGQWWHDRRRKVQWYTFWVAILVLVLTIVFGLIQSVTGVMQVYYATHPVQQPP